MHVVTADPGLAYRVSVILAESGLPSWIRAALRRVGLAHGEQVLRDVVVALGRELPPRPLISCTRRRPRHGVL